MKVLMINGSRRERGCTYTALEIVADSLKKEGIDSEIISIGKRVIDGEIDAVVKELKEKCAESSGFVFGSPVYYAAPSGEIQMVLDRLFVQASDLLRHKPAAVVASARRAGTTASLDVLAKYPSICAMPIVTSNYWTMVHGNTPEEVLQDEEGVAVMRALGTNMAWMLNCIEAGKKLGTVQPAPADKPKTNFIR